jgi:hypothetical protein
VLEEDGPLMRLLFCLLLLLLLWLLVVVACSIADQQKHSNDSFVPQHDYDHGIQSLVCGGQITKDRGPH